MEKFKSTLEAESVHPNMVLDFTQTKGEGVSSSVQEALVSLWPGGGWPRL